MLSSGVVVGVEVLPLVDFIVLKIAVIPKGEIRDARHTVLNFFHVTVSFHKMFKIISH